MIFILRYIYTLIFFPAIFERLRNILHESEIDKRVQYMIEVMFAIRKDGFKDHPIVPDGLDLVEEEDQFTHMLPLEDDYNTEDILSKISPTYSYHFRVFKPSRFLHIRSGNEWMTNLRFYISVKTDLSFLNSADLKYLSIFLLIYLFFLKERFQ